jgi:AraC family transcriptional regulator, transcriptional activator of pobA
MGQEKKYDISSIYNMKIEEVYGNSSITIETGGYCIFDRYIPFNGRHYHNCYELCYVISGRGEFVHGREVYELETGDIFIADPKVVHEISLPHNSIKEASCELHLVYFLLSVFGTQSISSANHEELIINKFICGHKIVSKGNYEIATYLKFIEDYGRYSGKLAFGSYQAVKAMMIDCLGSLSEVNSKMNIVQFQSQSILDDALDYIHLNTVNKLSVSEIASHACTSERNLQHLFRKYLNSTVVGYINERKMSLASNYLRMNVKVSDVCTSVGIGDAAQFSRLFKKYYNLSPKEYQMQYSTNGMVYSSSFKKRD